MTVENKNWRERNSKVFSGGATEEKGAFPIEPEMRLFV